MAWAPKTGKRVDSEWGPGSGQPVQDEGVSSVPSEPFDPIGDPLSGQRSDLLLRAEEQAPKPSFWHELRNDVGQTLASGAGVKAGIRQGQRMAQGLPPQLRLPVTAAMGSLGLVGGALAGQAGQMGLEQVGIMDPSPSELDLSPKERLRRSVAEEAIGEITGRAVGKVAARLWPDGWRPKLKTIPDLEEFNALLDEGARAIPKGKLTEAAEVFRQQKGVFLSPAMATRSHGIDLAESIVEHSFMGGEGIRILKKDLHPAAYQALGRKVASDYWATVGDHMNSQEVANLARDTMLGGKQAYDDMARKLYEGTDQYLGLRQMSDAAQTVLFDAAGDPILENSIVDISPMLPDVLPLLRMAEVSEGIGQASPVIRLGKKLQAVSGAATDEVGPTARLNFMEAHSLRSYLKEVARSQGDPLAPRNPRVKGLAKRAASNIGKAMDSAARDQGDDFYSLYKMADGVVAQGKSVYRNEFIKSASKSLLKNENALALTRSTFVDGNLANVKKLRSALTQTQGRGAWDALRATFFDDILSEANLEPGPALRKALDRVGDDVLEQLTESKAHAQKLRKIAQLGEELGKPTGGGGGILAPLTQAASFIALITNPTAAVSGSNVMILGGPVTMGKVLSNKEGADMISKGMADPDRMAYFVREAVRKTTRWSAAGVRSWRNKNRSREVNQKRVDRATQDALMQTAF